jgi:short-subunit dehydrogenase
MIVMSLSRWNGLALIVGAGGIGRALASQLRQRASGLHVVLCGRQQGPEVAWELDLEQQDSLCDLAPRIASSGLPLRLVINASGWLHDQHHQPEKRLQQVDADALLKSFSINAMAPLPSVPGSAALPITAVVVGMPIEVPRPRRTCICAH